MSHPDTTAPPPASLYLRDDCSLLLVRGDDAVEVRMSPEQLMSLACDGFRVAVMARPELVADALQAMTGAPLLTMEPSACRPS